MNINTANPVDHRISAQNARVIFEYAPYSIACTDVEKMLAMQSSPILTRVTETTAEGRLEGLSTTGGRMGTRVSTDTRIGLLTDRCPARERPDGLRRF